METFTRFGEYSILSKKHFGRALGQKKVVLFPEIGRVKLFYHLPACIVECVLEYTFLISKNNKQTTKKHKNQKSKRN